MVLLWRKISHYIWIRNNGKYQSFEQLLHVSLVNILEIIFVNAVFVNFTDSYSYSMLPSKKQTRNAYLLEKTQSSSNPCVNTFVIYLLKSLTNIVKVNRIRLASIVLTWFEPLTHFCNAVLIQFSRYLRVTRESCNSSLTDWHTFLRFVIYEQQFCVFFRTKMSIFWWKTWAFCVKTKSRIHKLVTGHLIPQC